MTIDLETTNQEEESAMLEKGRRRLRPETVEALREVLGGNDGADVNIHPETGEISVKDGDFEMRVTIEEIVKHHTPQPPKNET